MCRRAFVNHVDYAAGVPRAGHQSGGASDDFDSVIECHVQQCARHGAGLVFLGSGDAIYLVCVYLTTARIDVEPFSPILGHGDTRGLGQYFAHGMKLLVIHTLTRHDADGLRRFSNRQIHLGRSAGGARCVGPGPLSGCAQAHAIHVGRR
ncbi:hypothetical protein D3C76_1321710 [compost metagenome]